MTISVSEAFFGGNEIEYTADALRRGWITQGRYVERFEEAFAARLGGDKYYCLACSSGTAALHLAYLAAGVSPSALVVVPALTYIATANAAHYCGARIAVADVDKDSWCMTPATAKRAIGCSVPARPVVVPVRLYNFIPHCDVDGATIIEDCAQSIRSPLPSTLIATYSFYGSKVITTGEGGMTVTTSLPLYRAMKLLRGQGVRSDRPYTHDTIGYNYRMTDLQAAVGLAQLEQLPAFIERRKFIFSCYRSRIADLREEFGVEQQDGDDSYWMFAITLSPSTMAARVAHHMAADHIETRPFFRPIDTQLPYLGLSANRAPVAADLFYRGLCLPTHAAMTMNDVDRVIDSLVSALRKEKV